MKEFAAALAALPMGTFAGTALGRRYVVTKSTFAQGKSVKLVAEELGGPDYISLNWYDIAAGALLRPCEMPTGKVVDFVLAVIPDDRAAASDTG